MDGGTRLPISLRRRKSLYTAEMTDGQRVTGGHLTGWGSDDLPKLNGRPLHDLANPIRWLKRETADQPAMPTAYLEMVGGDVMPGRTIGLGPSSTLQEGELGSFLLVEPTTPVNRPDGPPRATVRSADALAAAHRLAAAVARSIRAVDAVFQRRPAVGLSLDSISRRQRVGADRQRPARRAACRSGRIAHAAHRLVERVFRASCPVDARLQAAADAIADARRPAGHGFARPRSGDCRGAIQTIKICGIRRCSRPGRWMRFFCGMRGS